MKRCLIVFAKEPKQGLVKTRLAQVVGEEKSLALYKAFLDDTFSMVRSVKTDEKFLYYSLSSDQDFPWYLQSISEGFSLQEQEGDDLGERMVFAVNQVRAAGYEYIVIVGSDSPGLPADYVREALAELEHFDVVLGPAQDGGFYLMGLAGEGDPAELFKGIQWSSDTVCKGVFNNAHKMNKEVRILKEWYDIDTADDLVFLKNKLDNDEVTAPATKQSILDN